MPLRMVYEKENCNPCIEYFGELYTDSTEKNTINVYGGFFA